MKKLNTIKSIVNAIIFVVQPSSFNSFIESLNSGVSIIALFMTSNTLSAVSLPSGTFTLDPITGSLPKLLLTMPPKIFCIIIVNKIIALYDTFMIKVGAALIKVTIK